MFRFDDYLKYADRYGNFHFRNVTLKKTHW